VKRLQSERALALPMAIGIMAALAIMITAITDYTLSNTRSASDSAARQLAYTAAEAGLNDALSALYSSSSFHTKTFSDGTTPKTLNSNSKYTVTYTWTATVNDPIWTLTAVGTVTNPNQGTRPITKTLKRTVQVTTAASNGVNTTIWNYIYSDAPPGSGCLNLANNSAIATPFYIKGDLCLSNNAHIDRNNTFSTNFPGTPQLQVGGKITLANGAYIGTSANKLNGVQTGQGCGSTPHNPCTSSDNVWANQYIASTPTLTKPVIDLTTWYTAAAPGPSHACTSPTGSPPAFDNDGVQNGTAPAVSLTTGAAYDCKFVNGAGVVSGEIKWTPGSPGQFVITGTIFYDGNISFDSNAVYSGRGVIYAAGTIVINANLCGVAACDTTWDTSANLLVLVAGSNNRSPSWAINMPNNNGSQFQGAMEANGDVNEQNNVGVWGSIVAHQVFISNNAIDHYVPFGTPVPGMPAQSGYSETLTFPQNSFSG
jgi:Tfp pilus assembly protein PilX